MFSIFLRLSNEVSQSSLLEAILKLESKSFFIFSSLSFSNLSSNKFISGLFGKIFFAFIKKFSASLIFPSLKNFSALLIFFANSDSAILRLKFFISSSNLGFFSI